MKEITEDLIERYVGFPESLTDHVRERIATALRVDRAARDTADFYREYYRQLRGETSGENRPSSEGHDGAPNGNPDHLPPPHSNGRAR